MQGDPQQRDAKAGLAAVCNVRCLDQPFTGMQRYTTEILKRVPTIQPLGPPRGAGRLQRHIWEQTVLPVLAKDSLIWHPANSGCWGVPCRQVVTIHDLFLLETPAFKACYHQWSTRRIVRRSLGILTVSNYCREEIARRYDLHDDEVQAIHPGVDHDTFRPRGIDATHAIRKTYDLPARYVLTLGSGSARKNLNRLLLAWERTQASRGGEATLVIAGDVGNTRRAFDGTSLRALPRNTRLLGRIPHADLPLLLAGATAFVFPSTAEGFGLPPLEAMASGVPVICSNATSLPEVVEDAAVLVDPLDPTSIASGLDDVLASSAKQNDLVARGLAHARRFSWDETAKRTAAFLASRAA